MRALTLASLLEKQLISPVEAATLKGLMSPFREKFINEIEKIIIPDIDDAVSDVSQKRTSEDNKLERLCLIIEQANMLDDRASSKNARVGFNTTIRRGFISSAAPATALTLAENVGKHVSGFASDFIISAAGHVVDGGLSSLFLTSYNEYKRIGDLAKKEKQIEETIQESETAQLLLQKNYAMHSQIYEDLLYRMEMDQLISSDNEAEKNNQQRQEILEEWLAIERSFNAEMTITREKIAAISANMQSLVQKRNVERVAEFLNIAAAFTAFAGHIPGMAIGASLKLIALGINIYGGMKIQEVAALNHGVSQTTDILILSEEKSSKKLREALNKTISPRIVLTGPTLEFHNLPGLPVSTKVLQSNAEIAEAFASKAKDHPSCTLSFSRPLADIPSFDESEYAGIAFEKGSSFKKGVKDHLEKLNKFATEISTELYLLRDVAGALLAKEEPHPYVTNLKQLASLLEDIKENMRAERKKIADIFNRDKSYIAREDSEGMKALKALEHFEKEADEILKKLSHYQELFEKTPHHSLFTDYGTEKSVINLSPKEREEIISVYEGSSPLVMRAKNAFIKEIEIHLETLETLSQACSETEGKHIRNFSNTLDEINAKINLFGRMLTPEQSSLFSEKIQNMKARCGILADRDVVQIAARIHHLKSHVSSHSARETYEELQQLKKTLESHDIGNTEGASAALEKVEQLQKSILPELSYALARGDPIEREKLRTAENDTVLVTGRRISYTFSEGKAIEDNVKKAIDALAKLDPPIQNIQLSPLNPISEKMITACRDDKGKMIESKLAKVIDGLSREIAFMHSFCEKTRHNVTVDNIAALIIYYEKQIEHLRKICYRPMQIDPRTPASIVESELNPLKRLIAPHIKSLSASEKELQLLKNEIVPQLVMPNSEASKEVSSFKF